MAAHLPNVMPTFYLYAYPDNVPQSKQTTHHTRFTHVPVSAYQQLKVPAQANPNSVIPPFPRPLVQGQPQIPGTHPRRNMPLCSGRSRQEQDHACSVGGEGRLHPASSPSQPAGSACCEVRGAKRRRVQIAFRHGVISLYFFWWFFFGCVTVSLVGSGVPFLECLSVLI